MAESLGQMPFGKYKDKDIEDIPNSYLNWVVGEDWFKVQHKELCANIRKELKYRKDFDIVIKEEKK